MRPHEEARVWWQDVLVGGKSLLLVATHVGGNQVKSRFFVAICVGSVETVATLGMLVARDARIGG